jgi:non-ribosomal peptide synthetase component F
MFADGVPENEMPTLPIQPNVLPFADSQLLKTIKLNPLKATAKRLNVSVFSVIFSAAALTLAKYCGSEDVVLGTALSGRETPEVNNLIGMFVNTLPLRIKVPTQPPPTPSSLEGKRQDDFVQEVARMITNVKSHQTFPFEKLVPILVPDRNPSRAPVFDLIVNYLHEFTAFNVSDLTVTPVIVKRQALATDLHLELVRSNDDINIELYYSQDLYEPAIVEGFLEQFVYFLNHLCEDKNKTLFEISDLPETHKQKILVDFAGEKTDENLGKTLVDLFREQAKKTPQNRAVVFGDRTITYSELDEISDRIATRVASGEWQVASRNERTQGVDCFVKLRTQGNSSGDAIRGYLAMTKSSQSKRT